MRSGKLRGCVHWEFVIAWGLSLFCGPLISLVRRGNALIQRSNERVSLAIRGWSDQVKPTQGLLQLDLRLMDLGPIDPGGGS